MTVIAEEKCWSVSRSGCGDGEVLLDPVLQPVPHVPTSLMSQPVPLGSLDSADEPSVSVSCAGSGDDDDVLSERQPVLLGSLVRIHLQNMGLANASLFNHLNTYMEPFNLRTKKNVR